MTAESCRYQCVTDGIINRSVSVGFAMMVVSVTRVIVVIFVVVPALMGSVVPPVGAVKWRDDAAAQSDGSEK